MYHRSLFAIVMETGRSILALTREMQGEDELFASALTLRAVEAQLLIMAHTLGNLTPALHRRLLQIDWLSWSGPPFRVSPARPTGSIPPPGHSWPCVWP